MPSRIELTLTLNEAAKFLHMSPAVLRQKACRGLIHGAKPGRRWVFLQSDLVAYLRSLYPTPEQAPLSDTQEMFPCHSLNAVKPDWFVLPHQPANKYADLLKLPTNNKHKSF
jgi:hypothetical protein